MLIDCTTNVHVLNLRIQFKETFQFVVDILHVPQLIFYWQNLHSTVANYIEQIEFAQVSHAQKLDCTHLICLQTIFSERITIANDEVKQLV